MPLRTNTFLTRQRPKLSEQREVIAVISDQVFAGRRKQALLCGAYAFCLLLFTGGLTEVGSWAANIVNISLKVGFLNQLLGLPQQRFVTSCLNDPPLMEGKGTKAATAETAATAGKAELDLLDGINAAVLFIHGMVVSHVGEVIGIIHLLSSQRLLRRILYHIGLFIIGLYQCFAT